jgi:hypothetical protein
VYLPREQSKQAVELATGAYVNCLHTSQGGHPPIPYLAAVPGAHESPSCPLQRFAAAQLEKCEQESKSERSSEEAAKKRKSEPFRFYHDELRDRKGVNRNLRIKLVKEIDYDPNTTKSIHFCRVYLEYGGKVLTTEPDRESQISLISGHRCPDRGVFPDVDGPVCNNIASQTDKPRD